jgi:serine/threonine protein kinase
MFHNDHVDELRPRDWRKSTIGRGGSGSVHMASWRGQELAVKIITLPPEPEAPGDKVRPLLKRTLQKITDSFVAEVEICCDLVHPNVVKLIGYATEPHLMLVQELMRGGSIDNQLYQQGWRPSHAQVHKVALDVARGMAFLHTAFQDTARHEQDKAIIHRDLKSANLMLSAPPPTSKEVGNLLVKISDFGLSKDKQTDAQHHTMKMTAVGGGTTLWMAPEMLEEKAYNEKIDVYSFAMCLIELVDGQLPWTNCCAPAMVATKVTQGEMRLLEPQLASAEPEVAQMVRECWAPDPNERPKFPDIVTRLEALMGIEASQNTALTQTVTRPEPSPPPGPLMEGGRSFVRSKVEKSTEEDRATWQEVQARVSESLPEYRVVRIDRLQNLELWRHYFLICFDLESATHGSGVNERRLFHWAPPEVFEMISGKDGSGFETRLARGGEYGDGAYFAQHAIYPLAYRTNSCRNREVHAALDWTVPQEPGTRISLLWARVALGNVCDFGARCASSRGNSAAKAAGEPPGLHGDWPMDVPRGAKQGHRQRPPPLKKPAWTGIQRARKDAVVREEGTYNSVSGTEANLEWTNNPRLTEKGERFGRQFVTFNPWQAYPELVVYLEKRDEDPEAQPECETIGGSE